MAYVYIVKCEDGSFYTGIASDIKRRIKEHYKKAPTCAKYTRSHKIKELSAVWEASSYSCAGKLEYYIKKKLTHSKKRLLIEENDAFKDLIPQELQEFSYKRIENITLESCLDEK